MIYGSMSTGLALAQSDVDIAIRGLEITSKEQLLRHMQTLCNRLQEEPSILKCTFIQTARVPVIKLVYKGPRSRW